MNIQQLATKHGISPATLRHYEKLGLLDGRHVERRANGYRAYTAAASDRVGIIRLGQLAGFSLKQLQTGLEGWEDDALSKAAREEILTEQLRHVDRKIEELCATRAYLVAKLRGLDQ